MSGRVKAILLDSDTQIVVSHATLWESLAKIGRGKLLLAGTSVARALQRVEDLEVEFLPVTLEHIVQAADLPQHHHDPFDRVIIAQAISQGIPVISSDGQFPLCDAEVIWK